MGILKTPKKDSLKGQPLATDTSIDTSILNDDSDIESITTVTTINDQPDQSNRNRHSNRRRYRNSKAPKAEYYSKAEGKRVRGNRHVRRHENMCFLMSLVEESDLNLDEEVTYEDIVRPQRSAFAKVMSENESLQIWTDFISRTGQEQDEIIDYAQKIINDEHAKKKRNNTNYSAEDSINIDDFVEYYHDKEKLNRIASSDDDYEVIVNDYLKEKYINLDKRLVLSEEKFKKIDKNIRNLLSRQVAIDTLENYEEKLVSTFSILPDGVYISELPSSFDRLILHGVCQYLDLKSKSFQKGGQRHTQVENNRNNFKLPSLLLSEFIKLKFSSSIIN